MVLLIRFSHHDGCRLVHPDTWYHLFGSPIMTDAVWCTPTRGITYSVSHHDGCRFGASRHVVSIIRFSHHDGCRLVHPDTWYQLFGSPIMTDAALVHPDTWYYLFVLPSCWIPFGTSRHVVLLIRFSHHDGCRIGASRHVVLLIRFSHHVGCRLVHPDMWY